MAHHQANAPTWAAAGQRDAGRLGGGPAERYGRFCQPGGEATFPPCGARRWWRAIPPRGGGDPHFGVPTVNIGQRQAGRIVCGNVLCCPAEKSDLAALRTALTPPLRKKAHAAVSPLQQGRHQRSGSCAFWRKSFWSRASARPRSLRRGACEMPPFVADRRKRLGLPSSWERG